MGDLLWLAACDPGHTTILAEGKRHAYDSRFSVIAQMSRFKPALTMA
jgi:hypothetical protein